MNAHKYKFRAKQIYGRRWRYFHTQKAAEDWLSKGDGGMIESLCWHWCCGIHNAATK